MPSGVADVPDDRVRHDPEGPAHDAGPDVQVHILIEGEVTLVVTTELGEHAASEHAGGTTHAEDVAGLETTFALPLADAVLTGAAVSGQGLAEAVDHGFRIGRVAILTADEGKDAGLDPADPLVTEEDPVHLDESTGLEDRVGIDGDDSFGVSGGKTEVHRGGKTEVPGKGDVGDVFLREEVNGPVIGPVVDNHHLQLHPGLSPEGSNAFAKVVNRIPAGNDHGDPRCFKPHAYSLTQPQIGLGYPASVKSVIEKARGLTARAISGTGERRQRLLLLVALPISFSFFAGVLAGVLAESFSIGLIALIIAIPVAILIGWLAGRFALEGAFKVRQEQSAYWIQDKIAPLQISLDPEEKERVNIIHPAIDLKHFFGGFIAVFTLARMLAERGHRVRLIALESVNLPDDWREQLAAYEGIGQTVMELEVWDASDRAPVPFNRADSVIATHWTAAWVADVLSDELDVGHFCYLIQEYEPFIFPLGSAALLAEGSYELDHTALFSTEILREYFAEAGHGVYRRGRQAGDIHSTSFQNAITPVGPVTVGDLETEGPGRLLFYARPEPHASRNLFEIGLMALDIAISEGSFSDWELVGIGKVDGGPDTLKLPRSGATLTMLPRAPQDQYAETLNGFDVGLALMYTPHPSLVPIEMAAAGMVTVTNTFDNKDREVIESISGNLMAADPNLASIASTLAEAEVASGDLDARAAGSDVDWPSNWNDALNPSTMSAVEQLLE